MNMSQIQTGSYGTRHVISRQHGSKHTQLCMLNAVMWNVNGFLVLYVHRLDKSAKNANSCNHLDKRGQIIISYIRLDEDCVMFIAHCVRARCISRSDWLRDITRHDETSRDLAHVTWTEALDILSPWERPVSWQPCYFLAAIFKCQVSVNSGRPCDTYIWHA